MLFNILAFISVIILITVLKRLVNIFPSLVACLIRWKESVNLEASVKNSYDRDVIAVSMIMPFCLTADRFRLYDPSFMNGMNENIHICITFGIFIGYLVVRRMASLMVSSHRDKKRIYSTAEKAAYTIFIILTLLLVTVGGVLSFLNVNPETTRNAMLWISAFTYALFLFRKLQIFSSSFSILTSFLYLCALEFIPTGLLIASVFVL